MFKFFNNPKVKKKIVSGLAFLLIIAMILPMVLSMI